MWLVKLKRAGFETVLFRTYSLDAAFDQRDALNAEYQTDEYYVEAYDPKKVEGFNVQ